MGKFAVAYFSSYEFMKKYGIDANKMLFDACVFLGIKVFEQSYFLLSEQNKIENVGLLVFIDDERYGVKSLGFSDVCLDDFVSNGILSWNTIFVPIKKIDSLKIAVGDESFRFCPTENVGVFFSNNENNYDIVNFSEVSKIHKKELIEAKNEEFLSDEQLLEISEIVSRVTGVKPDEIMNNRVQTRSRFFACLNSEKEARETLKKSAYSFLEMPIVKDNQNSTFDCATFVMFLFMSELGIDITKDGFGNSLTGKIMSSKLGENYLIDENKTVKEKREFVLKNANVGDVLLFHRQSKNAVSVKADNWFPGHVGVYVGDGKYIDARHRRGDIRLVDMFDDAYMECFIGFKNVVSSYFKELDFKQNEKVVKGLNN